jgi:hypothetical protein
MWDSLVAEFVMRTLSLIIGLLVISFVVKNYCRGLTVYLVKERHPKVSF